MLLLSFLFVLWLHIPTISSLDPGKAHPLQPSHTFESAAIVLSRRYDIVEQSGEVICELGDQNPAIIKRHTTTVSLSKRAPGKQPIADPRGRHTKAKFAEFMDGFVNQGSQLYIWPEDIQEKSWIVQVGTKKIPVGATGVWHPFTDKPEDFVMQGLTGCTAIIIVSPKGIWAGHLWEGSKKGKANGGSAFKERLPPGGEDEYKDRTKEEFKAVALDILDHITPAAQKQNRLWVSLADLRQDYGDPFGDGADVQLFVLTKSESQENSNALYAARIQELRNKYTALIPDSKYFEKYYTPGDPTVSDLSRGLIVAQYSPYDHDDGEGDDCTPQARVRVSYENTKGVIDKSWAATPDQIGSTRKRNTCEINHSWPIRRGYVAFGDSYAAGMGTGVTTADKCRIGTANIGDLINAYTGRSDIDYQRRMCSGDTTLGLNRQIDEWTNPERADVATLTAGGNDLDFSTIVRYCVLHTDVWWTNGYTTRTCNAAKAKAVAIMDDASENGIGAKLSAAYEKILRKSGRDDFHLYVSGYPGGFFNTDNLQPLDCKDTIFNYWKPSYCPHWYQACYGNDNIYLTVDIRVELNRYVSRLNDIISEAVDRVNSKSANTQVHYVDVTRKFDNHRWCEKQDDLEKHEPQEDRADTWFFLSAWKDIDLTGTAAAMADNSSADDAEINAMLEQGSVQLPPADSCEANLGTDPDPNEKWACMVSQGVAADPNGIWATKLREANAAIAAKNVSALDVTGFFSYTRQVKTFHPRTPGMEAYRDSIIDAINRVQIGGVSAETQSGSTAPSSTPLPEASSTSLLKGSTASPLATLSTVPFVPPVTLPAAPEPTGLPTLGLGQLECHTAFEGHSDVHADGQEAAAQEACYKSDEHMIKPGDASTNSHYEPDDWPNYVYDVYWTDGCNGTDTNVGKPLANHPDTCESLLVSTYKNCNNGGVGGKIQAGCLTYEYSVQKG